MAAANTTELCEDYQHNFAEQTDDYKRVEQAIEYMENHFQDQPNLDEIASSVYLSKYHFHRLFKRWAGVTPAQFLQYLTMLYTKQRLKASQSVLDASLDAGLSSTSRLHDLYVTFEGITPGEYKNQGEGMDVDYGFHPTPFGDVLLAATKRGICALRFVPTSNKYGLLDDLKKEWPHANFLESSSKTKSIVQSLFAAMTLGEKNEFHLFLKGTNFQIQVWQALLRIPASSMVTYQDVASSMSLPTATRAVANAIGKNPVAYIIPCHRVITKSGQTHKYRWGATRKKAILGWEAAHCNVETSQNSANTI
ncbi:MAG: methylated-DNA--[protein]-cysteine S-methyltransferase [SAR324 cluster bacterium]|nr:methylated-DNA--[protein]-cysteine S-methyltransferase [SAR324 cluster bacterium]